MGILWVAIGFVIFPPLGFLMAFAMLLGVIKSAGARQ